MKTLLGVVVVAVGLAACQNGVEPRRMASGESARFTAGGNGGGGGTCTLANGHVVATGFDQYGYNRCAHQFVGTYGSWCAQMGAPADCGGVSGDSRLVMKWNEEWDRGNATGWASGPYDAWLDNEARGPGWSEHFKTKWDATCAAGGAAGSDGGPCIWGPFEILMDQGTMNGQHVWWVKVSPAGYGA